MSATVAELAASIEVEGAVTASAQLDAFGRKVDTTAAQTESAAKRSMAHDDALRKLGTTSLVAGGAIVAGVGLATAATMRFDSAISEVNAVANVNERQMGLMRDAAIEAGQATVFSASEAAQAEAELAKAGLSTADILKGGLRGALDLASAGQLELTDAAIITAQALNIFGLDGTQASHVADVLAAGANKSAADVGQLGDALRQGGLLAKQTGLSLEDTVGTLALFADNALIGSDAGTSLKTMLQRLTPTSNEARDEMERLGISAYDANGQFVGLTAFAKNLQDSLRALTPEQRNMAMATIFGSDAVRAANLVYEAGPKKIREYVRAVNDQGAASDMAGKKLDNLGGDIEALSGSIETQLIKSGSGATTVLRFMAQGATDAVNAFSEMPAGTQAAAFGLTSVAGAGLLAFGAYAKIAPAFRETQDALMKGGRASQFLGANLGTVARSAAGLGTFFAVAPALEGITGDFVSAGAAAGALAGTMVSPGLGTVAGAGIGIVAGALGLLGEKADEAKGNVEGLVGSLGKLRGQEATKAFFDELGFSADDLSYAMRQAGMSTTESIKLLGANTENTIPRSKRRVDEFRDTFKLLATESPMEARVMLAALQDLQAAGGKPFLAPNVVDRLKADLDRGTDAYQRHAKNANDAKAGNQAYTDAALDAGGATSELADSLAEADTKAKNFKTSIDALLGIGLDLESANLRWRDSIDAINESLLKNGATLDINTEQGRNNREALAGSTRDAIAYAEAQFRATGDVNAASGAISAQIGILADNARQMGYNDEQVLIYIEDLLGIPPEARTLIHNTADLAAYVADQLKIKYDQLDGRVLSTRAELDTSQPQFSLDQLIAKAANIGITWSGWDIPGAAAATGMVVPARPGGTLIRVGEAGAPEVILPTNDDDRAMDLLRQAGLSRLLGGGTAPAAMPTASPSPSGERSLVVNFNGATPTRPRDVVDEVVWAMKTSGR